MRTYALCVVCFDEEGPLGSWYSVDDALRLLVDSLHRHLAQGRVVDLTLVVGLLVKRVDLVLDDFVLVRGLDRTRVRQALEARQVLCCICKRSADEVHPCFADSVWSSRKGCFLR